MHIHVCFGLFQPSSLQCLCVILYPPKDQTKVVLVEAAKETAVQAVATDTGRDGEERGVGWGWG